MIIDVLVKQREEGRVPDYYWFVKEGEMVEVYLACRCNFKSGVVRFTEMRSGTAHLVSVRAVEDCIFDDEVDALLAARDHCEFKRRLYQARLDGILMEEFQNGRD